ncbi:MAG: TRAP transporter large permease, partial [Pseudomonadota bacterium]|nr:TRAP transporter large permease [Pseudomonadota bacterium]
EILLRSGVSNRAYAAFAPVFSKVPGGLLHTNIAVCTIFGAVSGSSLSTAAAVGSVAYPEMTRRGYDRDVIVGSLAGGGTLGLLIPPSLSFLIFGALTETSIGRLFIAGILPGLMIGAAFMVYIVIKTLRHPHVAPREDVHMPFLAILRGMGQVWPLLLLILAVIGSIIGGLATPTEAAAVAAFYALLISAVFYRSVTFREFYQALLGSARSTASVGVLVAGAITFNYVITREQLPVSISDWLAQYEFTRWQFLIVVNILFLALGMVLEGGAILLIIVPILIPSVQAMGIDLIHFGVIVVVNAMLGLITPPYGLLLFITANITDEPITRIIKDVWPFILALMAALLVITFVPDFVLFLPRMLGYQG